MTDLPPVEFETVPCDLCGSVETEILVRGPDRFLTLPGEFTMVRCRHCGLVRQNPRPTPDSIGSYYPPQYAPFSVAIDDERSIVRRWDRRYGMWKRRRVVERHQSGGGLLDVGCATGNFLYEMARSGRWRVEGIEPNAEAVAYARQRFGLTVHLGRLAEIALPPDSFDVITLWNVLEHVHDPMSNLRAAYHLLRPGGFLVFSVPVMSSRLRQWFGAHWVEWDLPRHTFIYSLQTVEAFAEQAGIRVIAVTAPFSEYRVFYMSLVSWAREHVSTARRRSAIDAVVRFLPVRLMLALMFVAVVPARASSTLVFACQK